MDYNIALLVIDVQVRMFSEIDPVYNAGVLVENIKMLIERARSVGTPIILATVASSVTASAIDPSSNEAMLSGFQTALVVGSCFALFALLLALLSLRKKKEVFQQA